MEFDLRTKRNQYNTPIELFSKLSLTSELQPNNGSQLRVPQPSSISLKVLLVPSMFLFLFNTRYIDNQNSHIAYVFLSDSLI
uniref:Uncharacterized protein MANES_02G031400 n=1 Tax=Rhizophora mucronata TaxID=61149 RepID=A0A2P2LB58_RHIMU